MSRTKSTFIAVFLCVCLLLGGSMRPFFTYAAIGDDELDEAGAEEYDEPDTGNSTDSSDSADNKFQNQIDNITDKLKDLEEEKKAIEANINNVKSEKEKAIAVKDSLDREITITRGEISLLQERIGALEGNIGEKQMSIEEKQEDIEAKQNEIDENYEILRKRLRAMYMQDTTTTLGLIIGADSFSDLLTRIEYVRRIAEHDRNLLQTLDDQRVAMENEKVSLEEDKQELLNSKAMIESDKSETESKKGELDVKVSQAQLQIQDIAEMERAYLADLEKNKKIQQAAQAELDRIYQEIEWSKNPYIGGEMAWPLPGFYQLSSVYGPRFGGADFHTGMDITGGGVYGKTIVAANAGTVVKVNWSYTQGVGYGIYVVLDHGGNMSTLYAHCSNILVSVGDNVNKGQAIAQVGSTGWSTGPHLHFEVRKNGTHVNPSPYVTGK